MAIEAVSLLDKFKNGTPQVAQSAADAKPAIKNEQKTDEVVISKKILNLKRQQRTMQVSVLELVL